MPYALDTLFSDLTSLRAFIVQFRSVENLINGFIKMIEQSTPHLCTSGKLVYVRLRPYNGDDQDRVAREAEEDRDQPDLEERWMYARWTDEMIAVARSPGSSLVNITV